MWPIKWLNLKSLKGMKIFMTSKKLTQTFRINYILKGGFKPLKQKVIVTQGINVLIQHFKQIDTVFPLSYPIPIIRD